MKGTSRSALEQRLFDAEKLLLEAINACDKGDYDGIWYTVYLDDEWYNKAKEATK